jgi:hypothetical protein
MVGSVGADTGLTVLWGGPRFPDEVGKIACTKNRALQAIVDLDGGGAPDLVVSNQASVGVCFGRGAREFSAFDRLAAAPRTIGNPMGALVVDLDRDGRPEVATFTNEAGSDNEVVFLRSEDGYNYAPVSARVVAPQRTSRADAWRAMDIDADDRTDLALWSETGLYVFRNEGMPR